MPNEPCNYRKIPHPLLDFRLTATLYQNARRSRAVDYVKTDQPYLIELTFQTDVDLALFEKYVQGSTIRLTEYSESPNEQSRIFVTDSRIDVSDCCQEPVFGWVRNELPKIGATIGLRFPEFVLPKFRCLIELHGKKGLPQAVAPPKCIHIPADEHYTDLPGILKDDSGKLLLPSLEKCDADDDFHEALVSCGQALDIDCPNPWVLLYRAYEIVEARFAASHGRVEAMGFCTKNELERFKRTCNHQEATGVFSRHARLSYDPPPYPMTLEQAKEFVFRLVRRWLEHAS